MATDWGYPEKTSDSLKRIADLIDEAADSTADDEKLRVIPVNSSGNTSDPIDTNDASQIHDDTTTAGNNVSLDLGDLRNAVDILADVNGSATLTVSVSNTGDFSGEEHSFTIDYSNSGTNLEQFEFAYQHIQASVNQNLNELEIVSRGL